METSELIELAKEQHLEVREVNGSYFVLVPMWQVETFPYYPLTRQYVYNHEVEVVEKSSTNNTPCYVVPIKYLELDKDYIPTPAYSH